MAKTRPNILFVLADDLGYSDIGCYGAEIHTPNIDRLAAEGVRMLNFHAAAACSPTRAMLLSGTDAHLGGLGTLIEYKNSERGAKRWAGKAGYEGFLNGEVITVPEVLSKNGYDTILSGKWHLGLRASQGPWNRGFQKAFAMLPGCCNHYGWEPVQEKFPVGGRPVHAEMGHKVDVQPNKTEDPGGFYSTNSYTSRLLDYLKERNSEPGEKPFFAFLPFTAPHWPLQCTKAQRDKYKGVYDDGPYALRKRRLQALQDLGLVDPAVVPHEMETATLGAEEWNQMSPEERRLSSRAMEAYAGMVDSIDVNVGRVVDYLKSTGEYDNTMIVFMSDNGAEGAAMEAVPVMGDNIRGAIHKYYDNSYDNIGAYNSFTWLGPLWAQASTAPSRLFKCFPSQGGIHVPCVIKPAKSQPFCQPPGSFNRSFTTVMDFAATFLDLAHVQLPAPFLSRALRKDRLERKAIELDGRQYHAMKGVSLLPHLVSGHRKEEDEQWAVHASTEAVGWELFSRGALRKGDWKIVHIEGKRGGAGDEKTGQGWELFNIVKDPGETKDLGSAQPAKLAELLSAWEAYVVECGIVWGPSAWEDGLSASLAPELWQDELELQKDWMGARGGECPVVCA